ncbi:MAG: hypothetical protein CMO19_03920 [Thaumarchaeota archaeon]|nr:hypothetical protein [Nitrososphaerota archaeon]|tara:strand:+ start:8383 stop:9711 length:1329 start_codon:yes stop_codon:yes gene_type:complete
MNINNILSIIETKISTLDFDDYSLLLSNDHEDLIRFSNNSVNVFDVIENISIEIYIGKDKKRASGVLYNLDENSILSYIDSLFQYCIDSPINNDYTALPSGPFNYGQNQFENRFDSDNHESIIDHVENSINQGLKSGASRVCGSFTSTISEIILKTSTGIETHDKSITNLLNVRAFTESKSSGHGLSCSSSIRDIDSSSAGTDAGEYAKSSINPKQCEPGKYDILFTPTVAADIFQFVGHAASADSVDSGDSFLTNKLNHRVSSDSLSISDHGNPENGIYNRRFDDEGIPTQSTKIIENGILKNYLHNVTTAKKYEVDSTGNAGIMAPWCWNLEVSSGSITFEEQLSSIENGLLITNNWYTRFQNPAAGSYSTVPRDACFIINNGKITNAIQGIRISDDIPRQLSNIDSLSNSRKWISWWEVETPVLSPSIVIKDVPVTRST